MLTQILHIRLPLCVPYFIQGSIMTRKVVSYGNSLTIESQYLGHYLTVYNRYTGNEVGCIGNISSNSIMLLTPWMMEVGSTFYFRILLPAPIAEKTEIDFDAKCQWCHPDVDPRGYDSGYTIIDHDKSYSELIDKLQNYFSFKKTS